MRERLRLYGGQLQVESGAQGTLLRASLPIVAEGPAA
jgi:signal transduction histidine kinase